MFLQTAISGEPVVRFIFTVLPRYHCLVAGLLVCFHRISLEQFTFAPPDYILLLESPNLTFALYEKDERPLIFIIFYGSHNSTEVWRKLSGFWMNALWPIVPGA
jgi:hypothetical protein